MIEFKEGDYVKIAITEGNVTERMFFEVLHKYEKNFLGMCSNTPVKISNIEYGKDYTFSNDQVVEKYTED